MDHYDDESEQWDDGCLCPCCLEDSDWHDEDCFYDDEEIFDSILTFEDER